MLVLTAFTALSTPCLADSSEMREQQAFDLRESGQTLDALNFYNHLLVDYRQQKDYHGVLRVLAGRLISWQHLFNHKEDKTYALLARQEAESMLLIAQEYAIDDQNHTIHCLLGKSCILLKDFARAEAEFTEALRLLPHDGAEKGDWLARLGEAIYRNKRKEEGEQTILEGIK